MNDLLEVTKFASLWAMKDTSCVHESKAFWFLMEMSINMAINRNLRLSPTIFKRFSKYVEFKADFHYVSMRARKDSKHKWYDLPYLAIDDAIAIVLEHWLVEWCTTSDLSVGSNKPKGK